MKMIARTTDVTITKGTDGFHHVVWYEGGVPLRAKVSTDGTIYALDSDPVPDNVRRTIEDTLFPRTSVAKFTDNDGRKNTILVQYDTVRDDATEAKFFYDVEGNETEIGTLNFPTRTALHAFVRRLMSTRDTNKFNTRTAGLLDYSNLDLLFEGLGKL